MTPSSKVVGDLALMMVSQDLKPQDILDPTREVAFPASVVEMLHGDLGQPPGGWPEAFQKKVLKGEKPITVRPGSLLEPIDFDAATFQFTRQGILEPRAIRFDAGGLTGFDELSRHRFIDGIIFRAFFLNGHE